MQVAQESEITCPFCGEQIAILVECSEIDQIYVEDCSVCCNPIRLHVHCSGSELLSIDVDRES